MARPRVCCAGETEGSREVAQAVEGATREAMVVRALGEGACRESILDGGCAQLSEVWRGGIEEAALRFKCQTA